MTSPEEPPVADCDVFGNSLLMNIFVNAALSKWPAAFWKNMIISGLAFFDDLRYLCILIKRKDDSKGTT